MKIGKTRDACNNYINQQLDIVARKFYTTHRGKIKSSSQVLYRKKVIHMKKNLSREIMGAVNEMGKERVIVLWFARRRMYRADEICHICGIDLAFHLW